MSELSEIPQQPALPATVGDLRRKTSKSLKLVDQVEEVVLRLYDNPDFRKLLEATTNKESAEGSLVADDLMASRMIREEALVGSSLSSSKLTQISTALKWALKRFEGLPRDARRQTNGTSDNS